MTSHVPPAAATIASRRILPAWLSSTICGAMLVFVALVVLWLGQTSRHVYTRGADALVIRAVLRTDADAVATEKLAGRIREKIPEMGIEIINESMGRSLLALQEPWIAQMPDFEVTPLPTLLEMRHPNLLTHPAQVTQFVKELEQEPEVDFVAYNETAHDQLTKLADSTALIESHATKWLLMAIALAGLIAQLAFAALAHPHSVPGVVIRHAVCGLGGWLVGLLLFRWWETGAVATGEWQRLTSGQYLLVGVCALAVMGLSATIKLLVTRFHS